MMSLLPFKSRCFSPAVTVLLLSSCVLPPQHTREYSCPDGYEFTIRYSGSEDPGDVARLEDESGTSKLPRAPAASGARYSNGVTTFWEKGDTAMILHGDEVMHEGCT